jgi:hypothetical protein
MKMEDERGLIHRECLIFLKIYPRGDIILNFRFDKYGNIGVFTFVGKIDKRFIKDIKVLLMHSLESMDRVVLNFGKEVVIDTDFRNLIERACRISKRMGKPFIMNGYGLKVPDGALHNAAAIYTDEDVKPLR